MLWFDRPVVQAFRQSDSVAVLELYASRAPSLQDPFEFGRCRSGRRFLAYSVHGLGDFCRPAAIDNYLVVASLPRLSL